MELLHNFLDWWLRQLVGLLPLPVVQLGFAARHAAILEVAGNRATLYLRQSGKLTPIARGGTDPAELQALIARATAKTHFPDIVLRLGGTAVLRKQLTLPASARRHIEKLLGFEIDRETPFARDEVYWAHALRRHDGARVDVDLVIIPRAEVDPLVAIVRKAGATVAGLEIASTAGKSVFVTLDEEKRHHRLFAYRPLLGPAAIAAALAAIAIITPFARLHFAMASADKQIAALTASATEASSLRKSSDQYADTAAYLDQESKNDGPALAVLASITRVLPDDTYLTALSLHAGHVTIIGLAPSAAKVVDLIAKDPMFSEPVFDSPVVQDSNSGLESFTLSLALKTASPS